MIECLKYTLFPYDASAISTQISLKARGICHSVRFATHIVSKIYDNVKSNSWEMAQQGPYQLKAEHKKCRMSWFEAVARNITLYVVGLICRWPHLIEGRARSDPLEI